MSKPDRTPRRSLVCLLVALLVAASGAAAAAQGEQVSVELNKLEPADDACRTYLVLENGFERELESLRLDLVVFDTDGIIARRLAVETGPLAAGTTRVKAFNFDRVDCDAVGRLLLNGVLDCETADGAVEGCARAVEPSSRGDVPFIR